MELTHIGRYEIKSELGRGGMATVYRAYDPSFDREVAVKVLPREFLHNPQFLDRFQREIKTIAQLEHPAIVSVYDVGEHDGIPFFVMRYMTGGSLSDMIKKGRFTLEDTARIVERLASALSYAHRKGVVHRDLKPDNILFNDDGYPFISDFGIAKFTEAHTNLTGSGIIGTPAYMSPEQATGDPLDHRSDIYGLGVIVYQMLSGQQPYNADTPMGVAIKHVTDPVPDIRLIVPDLPEEMGDVMKKVLAKDREQRYATAVEFARALNQAAFGDPGNIQESSPTVRLIEKPTQTANTKLYIGGAIAIGLVVCLLVLFGAIRLFSSGSSKNTETVVPPTVTADILAETPQGLVEQPTTTPELTDTPNAPAGCGDQQYYTDEFDSSLCNWDAHAVIGSDFNLQPDVTVEPNNGNLVWNFNSKSASYYLFHDFTSPYADVKVGVRVNNLGVNSNEIGLICQYDPKAQHWYEFRIIKGGFYKIWYAEIKSGNKLVFDRIADGASTFIKPGKDVNEYYATCSGNTLFLTVNGHEEKTYVDKVHALRDGGVGVSVSSLDIVGVNMEMEWFKVSQP